MAARDALQQKVSPGETLKPWLILGPLYDNVSDEVVGLSLYENVRTDNGLPVIGRFVDAADGILSTPAHEGDACTYGGEDFQWELVRRPEPVLMWGRYNISNHVGSVLLATTVRPEKAGRHALELLTRISSRARVYLNGKPIYDTESDAGKRTPGSFRFHVELPPGPSHLAVALFRLGRMAQVGFRLTCTAPLSAAIPLASGTSVGDRTKVEADIQALRLEQDLVFEDERVALRADPALQSGAKLVSSLVRGGRVVKTVRKQPGKDGALTVARGSDLPPGNYELRCTLVDEKGVDLTGVAFSLIRTTRTKPMTGHDRLDARRKIVLEHQAEQASSGDRNDVWTQVARYALGRYDDIDEGALRFTLDFIANRLDCSDFVIQGILRLLYWDRGHDRLSPEIRAMAKDTILGFRYWADEPGDDVMFMGSENHRLLFHVAEFLGGQLYPLEEFTNSRQRGLYHVTKARMFLMEWLRQRGRFGFDEWHSNSYYPVNIAPLLNLYDFADALDYKLRILTSNVLHYAFFNLAADTHHGIFGTTHGRSYARNLVHPAMEGTSCTCWLLYGEGSLQGGGGMSPVSLATSGYTLPELLTEVATDREAVVESRQQQGSLAPTSVAPSANFVVYRTPDYLLSGLQDHRKGEYESSTHVGQASFDDGVVVFFSCPHTTGEGGGLRPDYWSGHTTLPRVIQHRNVQSYTWRLTDIAWLTHAFFEQDRFDEVRFEGNWAFGKKNRGYVGIWSQNGMEVGKTGQYAGRELVCFAKENTWIVECGREADWKSFGAFCAALAGAPIKTLRDRITYESPSIGSFVTGWDATPTVDGTPISLIDYPLVESPFAHSAYGGDEMLLEHGDDRLRLFFNF